MFYYLLSKSLPADFNSPVGGTGDTDSENTRNMISQVGETLNGYGFSGVRLMTTILVYVAAIGFIIFALKMIRDANDPEKTSENKKAFVYKVIAVILGFAAVGLVILAWNVGNGLLK